MHEFWRLVYSTITSSQHYLFKQKKECSALDLPLHKKFWWSTVVVQKKKTGEKYFNAIKGLYSFLTLSNKKF